MADVIQTKLRAGRRLIPAVLTYQDDRIFVKFPYNKKLLEEVRAMQNARWHGYDEKNPKKVWSVADTARNNFQLDYLQGKNVFAHYDADLLPYTSTRPLRDHQLEMVRFCITRRYCILAAEMGTGKTLVAIETMEWIKANEGLTDYEAWYVGPKSGVRAVSRELRKWESSVKPRMFTYEGMTKEIKNWSDSDILPKVVIFDESSKLKTPTSQRSQCALHLAENIRKEYGYTGAIIEMSGTPAPKAPVDWWQQCCAGDTLIQTDQGLRRLDNIINTEIAVVISNKQIRTKGSFLTGKKQLYLVQTKEGYTVRATEDHRFLVNYGGQHIWRELKDLELEDELIVSDVGIFNNWKGPGTKQEGYILGLLFGDGTVKHDKSLNAYYGTLKFFEDDFCILPKVKEILDTDNVRTNMDEYKNIYKQIHGGRINEYLRDYNVTNEKMITSAMLYTSSDFFIGFLSGIFDCDGTAEKSRARITLTQTNRYNLEKIQIMLQALGIYSKIYSKKMYNSNILGRRISGKPSNTLIIANQYAEKFQEVVGFNILHKKEILAERIKNRHNWYTQPVGTISSITKDEIEDVYDITVPDTHAFSANGIIVHNCEIACPGFLREGTVNKFKARMCLIEERQSLSGGMYPHIVTWLDDENKCSVCGELKEHPNHEKDFEIFGDQSSNTHTFVAADNEVAKLYKRMQGLVDVRFKKDCTDLPDKQYRIIQVTPTPETLRASQIIKAKCPRAVTCLTLLRELSDGFQYADEVIGETDCPECFGTGTVTELIPSEEADPTKPIDLDMVEQEHSCYCCGGTGKVPQYKRTTEGYSSPKDEVFIDLLDEHTEIGRFVVWGGFTGTIERLIDIAHQHGWATLRYDKLVKGENHDGTILDPDQLLDAMDRSHPKYKELMERYPKICFVGHPDAGGQALTLHASPTALYYSNSFKGESRIQSEDRIHRIGMDENKGATIIDLVHLNTDLLVLNNLRKKKKLQNMTMAALEDSFTMNDTEIERY